MTATRIIILFFFLTIITGNIHSQLSGTELMQQVQSSGTNGRIAIHQSDEIVKLIDKHLYEESKKKGIMGYRIRLFSDSGSKARKEGEKIIAGFLRKNDEVKTYYYFDTPFYRLDVGDFRSQSEAKKYLNKIERDFPDAFIIRSKIKYPSL